MEQNESSENPIRPWTFKEAVEEWEVLFLAFIGMSIPLAGACVYIWSVESTLGIGLGGQILKWIVLAVCALPPLWVITRAVKLFRITVYPRTGHLTDMHDPDVVYDGSWVDEQFKRMMEPHHMDF